MSTYEYSDEQGDTIVFSSLPQFPFSMISISGKNVEGRDAVRSVVIPDVEIEDFTSNMRDALGLSVVPDVPVKFDPANGLVRVGDGINTVVLHTSSDIDDIKQIRDNYIAGVAWLESELENALVAQKEAESLKSREEIAQKFGFSPDSEVVRYIDRIHQQLREKS